MFNNNTKIVMQIFVLITLLILLYMIYKICDSDKSLDYYIYSGDNTSNTSGPVIAIIGGTHGNEPIGSIIIRDLIKKLNNKDIVLNRGKLILIPDVNYCALKLGIRYIPVIGDLNRKYPKNIKNNYSSCPITHKIINLIKDADFILDFHEGWGFHKINNMSMGSSITPTDTQLSNDLSELMYDNLNNDINEYNKKFTIFVNDNRYITNPIRYSKINDIKGSLRYYANIMKKNYVLIEITGQNNIQTIEIRKKQADKILNVLFNYFNLF
jgi:uncharacterized protein